MPQTSAIARAATPRTRMLAAVFAPILALVALVSWGFASPIGSSPDDDYHMASIWCGQGIREDLCEEASQADERRIPAVIAEAAKCFAFDADQSASCTRPPADEMVETKRGNFVGNYPPIYYATMSIFAGPDPDASVLAMRTANSVIFVGLLTALAVLVPPRLRRAVVLPFAVTAVPLGMFLVPSINPSSWAILSAAGLWIAMVGFVRAEETWRRVVLGALALVLTVVGAGARSDSAAYAGLAVLVALILTYERARPWYRGVALAAALAIIAVIAFLTSGQSGAVAVDDSSPFSFNLVLYNLTQLPTLWIGALGTWNLGWLDTAMPGIVWVGSTVVFVAFVFTGLRRMSPRKGITLALVMAALIVVPMYILVNEGIIVGEGVQPRYTYPLLIILAGLAFWHRDAVLPRFSMTQAALLVGLLVVGNSVALHSNIRRYVTGIDVGGYNLESAPEWWWSLAFGPNWVWLIGSLAFAGSAVAIWYWSAQADRVTARAALA